MNASLTVGDFGVLLADGTRDKLGDEYSVRYQEITKNNGVLYHALVIRKNEDNVAPTIYIDRLYSEYLKGRKIGKLTDDVIGFYNEVGKREKMNVDFFTDFSKVADCLGFKVINLEKNRQFLSDVPYRQLMDLALVPICYVKNMTVDAGCITIHNKHLEIWEISEEELWENAYENAGKAAPVKLVGISNYISKQTGIPLDDCLDNVLVVTNQEMINGASAAFLPGVLKNIAKKLDSDLVIIPSSVHETIVLPSYMAGLGSLAIAQMIKEVNESVVSDEEILSDNAYYYNMAEDTLSIFK